MRGIVLSTIDAVIYLIVQFAAVLIADFSRDKGRIICHRVGGEKLTAALFVNFYRHSARNPPRPSSNCISRGSLRRGQ